MKKRFLFVDDDANILQGLRRMLRSRRNEWEMAFAQSGEEALRLMDEQPFDAVVTDMRMPAMDGASLLDEIKGRTPGTIRIILSGQSDDDTVLQALAPTHQYLSKPCDSETLKQTLSRACALHDLLKDEQMKALIGSMQSLPSISAIHTQLLQKLRSPEATTDDVGEVIRRDMGMTTKILQLVNSAQFGPPRPVADPGEAARILGLETIRALATTVQENSLVAETLLPDFSLSDLWRHSLTVGTLARAIAGDATPENWSPDGAMMAGLLHDTGKLVLAARAPERYAAAISLAREQNKTPIEAETEIFGTTHAEVGAYLLGMWGLPDVTVEAVAFHHRPGDCPSEGPHPSGVLHVADALLHRLSPKSSQGAAVPLDEAYLQSVGQAERISEWEKRCRTLMKDCD